LNNFNRVLSLKIVLLLSIAILSSCSSFNLLDSEDTVPKEKYEDLLKKYKSLIGKKLPASPQLNESVNDSKALSEFRTRLNSVDVQKSNRLQSYDQRRVQKDISLLYQAYEKYHQKSYGDVIIILKELEKSQVQKVRGQARYLLALTMLAQGELDLSMQVFEEIVVGMRESVFALLSLKHLISTTKKLGLIKKHKYFTQLYARFLN